VLGRRERMPLMGRSKEGVSERLAAEEAVGATRCAGRLMGRVGDFGRGFTKPVAERMPSVCGRGLGGLCGVGVLRLGLSFEALLVVPRANDGNAFALSMCVGCEGCVVRDGDCGGLAALGLTK
jgi:hypothetical protein